MIIPCEVRYCGGQMLIDMGETPHQFVCLLCPERIDFTPKQSVSFAAVWGRDKAVSLSIDHIRYK